MKKIIVLLLVVTLIVVILTSIAKTEEPTTIVAVGDIAHCDVSEDEKVSEIVAALKPDALLTLGDTVYNSGTEEEFRECYDPAWGQFKNITKPSPGNHDYGEDGYEDRDLSLYSLKGYENYFGRTDNYYSFNHGDWKIISLDSNCFIVGCEEGSEQFEWFKEELENSGECTIAYWHHPVYSSGYHQDNYGMHSALDLAYDKGVDIVLNGHDHVYDRRVPIDDYGEVDQNGVRQFTVGTGGKSLHEFGKDVNTDFRSADHIGVLRLELHDGEYRWAFVTPEGIVDSGKSDCN